MRLKTKMKRLTIDPPEEPKIWKLRYLEMVDYPTYIPNFRYKYITTNSSSTNFIPDLTYIRYPEFKKEEEV